MSQETWRPERFELEAFCGPVRQLRFRSVAQGRLKSSESGSPQPKSRASARDPGHGPGAPGEIRTPDLQLRRLPLYPAELRARAHCYQFTCCGSQRPRLDLLANQSKWWRRVPAKQLRLMLGACRKGRSIEVPQPRFRNRSNHDLTSGRRHRRVRRDRGRGHHRRRHRCALS